MPMQCSFLPCRLALVVAALLRVDVSVQAARQAPQPVNYYQHGVDWRQGMCASRERQSPVNFDTQLKAPPTVFLNYKYDPIANVAFKLEAGSGMLYVDMSERMFGGITYGTDWYPLVRIDFHQGEHTIKGVRQPLEIQLLHRKLADPVQQIIVSVLVWCETTPRVPDPPGPPSGKPFYPPDAADVDFNSELQHFLTTPVPDVEGTSASFTTPANPALDLNKLIGNDDNPNRNPEDSTFLFYGGSFTSPPCTDHALWLVRRKTVVASDAQVKALTDSLYRLTGNRGSYREIMPMNNRPVKVAKLQMPPPGQALTVKRDVRLPWGPIPRTDGEFQAGLEAEKVNAAAEQAVRYTADLARRLRASDKAYANRLNTAESAEKAADPGDTDATKWFNHVSRVRSAITGAVLNVGHTADQAVRNEVVGIHEEAATQAEIARHMHA